MEWKRRSAYVFVRTRPGSAESVFMKVNQWDHTIGAFMTHWPWDVLVWMDAENIEDAHKWVAEIRSWREVEWTSTQPVFMGFKREYWFWEREACAWVKIRSKAMSETYEDLKRYEWMATFASVPGDWDCIGLVSGNNWQDVFMYMAELKEKGYEIECYTPFRWWWNETWRSRWWSGVPVSAGA
jgi:hypothetical protein